MDIEKYKQYEEIISTSFEDLLNTLRHDISKSNDIYWIYNPYISADLYYSLIDNLTLKEYKKFMSISKKTVIDNTILNKESCKFIIDSIKDDDDLNEEMIRIEDICENEYTDFDDDYGYYYKDEDERDNKKQRN